MNPQYLIVLCLVRIAIVTVYACLYWGGMEAWRELANRRVAPSTLTGAIWIMVAIGAIVGPVGGLPLLVTGGVLPPWALWCLSFAGIPILILGAFHIRAARAEAPVVSRWTLERSHRHFLWRWELVSSEGKQYGVCSRRGFENLIGMLPLEGTAVPKRDRWKLRCALWKTGLPKDTPARSETELKNLAALICFAENDWPCAAVREKYVHRLGLVTVAEFDAVWEYLERIRPVRRVKRSGTRPGAA